MTTEPKATCTLDKTDTRNLRTLHALERLLDKHGRELMALDCQDAAAAEAILFAVGRVDRALEHAREARRQLFRDARAAAAARSNDDA